MPVISVPVQRGRLSAERVQQQKISKFLQCNRSESHSPDGCVFRSKWAFNNSKACGVNDVLRFRFLDGSTPIKSFRWLWLPLYRFQWLLGGWGREERILVSIFVALDLFKVVLFYLSSASFIHRSRTGLILCALFGVMSNFSNLHEGEEWTEQNIQMMNLHRHSFPSTAQAQRNTEQ